MTKVRDILEFLDSWAPVDSCEDWDNVGLLVGRQDADVSKILVALDITRSVMEQAVELGAELIVAHHPVIFSPVPALTETGGDSLRALYLAENRVAAICMHTNLDFADGGVDQTLPIALGFGPSQPLSEDGGRVSQLGEPVTMAQLLPKVKSALGASGLRYYDSGRPVKKIATVCGSGGSYLHSCIKSGCDTLITGDIKHDVFVEAELFGVNLIDAGHFDTENIIVPVIANRISLRFPHLSVSQSLAGLARFYV